MQQIWLMVNYASLRKYNFFQENSVKLLPKKELP
jgi:hypothetical protein